MRKEEIIKLKEQGMTWREISLIFGISKTRTHQIGSGYKKDKELWQKIFVRDGFKCKCNICDNVNDRIVIHHIDFNDRNNRTDNLISMHNHCHAKYHSLLRLNEAGHNKKTKLHECLYCKKYIYLKKKTCGRDCRRLLTESRLKRICKVCKKEYISRNKRPSTFCSNKCQGVFVGKNYGWMGIIAKKKLYTKIDS